MAKSKELGLNVKQLIVKSFQDGVKKAELARRFGIPRTTITSIIQRFTLRGHIAPDKPRICVFYAMKTSKNACIIRSECTHYAYILLCNQTFQIRSVLVRC